MEEKETQVVEDITENTEETVEETEEELVDSEETAEVEEQEELLTQKQFEETLKKRLARQREKDARKYEKELNEKLSKYQRTEAILQNGLEVSNIDEANEKLKTFYEEKGIKIPEAPKKDYSDWEISVLAKAEAEELIDDGYEEMEKEANRLATIGVANLNKKDKIIFNTIASKLVVENNKKSLAKNGIDSTILDDAEFNKFTQKFKANENIVDVYNLYKKNITAKKNIKPIGSLKTIEGNKVKDYYTPEEARKLTVEDYNKDPKLEGIVMKSMAQWN